MISYIFKAGVISDLIITWLNITLSGPGHGDAAVLLPGFAIS